jgi:hypothetical protein
MADCRQVTVHGVTEPGLQESSPPLCLFGRDVEAGPTLVAIGELSPRLRLTLPESDSPKRAWRDALAQRARESDSRRWDILDAIDFRDCPL